jgi:hypothetical protein
MAIGALRMSRSYIFGVNIAWTSVASFWAAAMSSNFNPAFAFASA